MKIAGPPASPERTSAGGRIAPPKNSRVLNLLVVTGCMKQKADCMVRPAFRIHLQRGTQWPAGAE